MQFFTSSTSNIAPQHLALPPIRISRAGSQDSTATNSSTSSTPSTSSASWLPSPFRSCLQQNDSPSSSYLNDDELLSPDSKPAIPSTPTNHHTQATISTEEQIERIRRQKEQEEAREQTSHKSPPRALDSKAQPHREVDGATRTQQKRRSGLDAATEERIPGKRKHASRPPLKKRPIAVKRLADLGH